VGREGRKIGARKEGKGGGGGSEVQRSQGKVRRVCTHGSHEWGREGSGDCRRVAIEEIGVSKRRGGA